jgi:hypothetical protein
MGEKWAGIVTYHVKLDRKGKLWIPVYDYPDKGGQKTLGTLLIGQAGLRWKVGKHTTAPVAFEDLRERLEGKT